MFSKLKNMESSFQLMRGFLIVLVAGCLLTTTVVGLACLRMVGRAHKSVYVIVGGKAVEAMASSRKENLLAEAKDHIRSFHELFFTLAPDEKMIHTNLSRALYLADGSARKLYDDLRESGYFAGIISGNYSQAIEVDSVRIVEGAPVRFVCYARLHIVRPTSIVTRSLVTEGQLRETARSDNDPHGFLIERWRTVENKDLKVEAR